MEIQLVHKKKKIIVETTGKSVRKWSLLYTVDRIVT